MNLLAFLTVTKSRSHQVPMGTSLAYSRIPLDPSQLFRRAQRVGFSSQPWAHLVDNDEPTTKETVNIPSSCAVPSKIGRLVLVRHGQSEWNVTDPTRNLTSRFTGWADIGLTAQGRDQAVAAGRAIKKAVSQKILPRSDEVDALTQRQIIPKIDVVFCSLLKRATDTMNLILEELHLAEPIIRSRNNNQTAKSETKIDYQYHIPVVQSWRLNERHYGALVGLSKEGAERLYGKIRLTRWRDSWDVPPPPMPLEMVQKWGREDHCQPVTIVRKGTSGRTCVFDPSTNLNSSAKHKRDHNRSNMTTNEDMNFQWNYSLKSGIRIKEHGRQKKKVNETSHSTEQLVTSSSSFMPPSESLSNTYERFLPLWIQGIAPHLRAGRTVLVVAHANTIRSMLFAIDADVVTKENSKQIKIPSALPLIYEFVDGDAADMGDSGNGFVWSAHNDFLANVGDDTHKRRRDCSEIVSGNLRVLKPYQHSPKGSSVIGSEAGTTTTVQSRLKKEMMYQLNGIWVETDETKLVSFCTEVGKLMGEQDIA